jgi:hypothetical protein
VSLLVPEQAGAAPSCTSSQANRFAGYLTTSADGTGNTYEGIQANISNQGGIPCSGGGSSCCNFIFDWVMLATPLTGTNDNARAHIQIGYFQYEGSCVYFATEVQQSNGGSFSRIIDTADGCRTGPGTTFTVRYNPSTTHEEMDNGARVVRATTWNPYAYWQQNFVPEVSGEGLFLQDAIAGTLGDPTNVTNIHMQRYDDSFTTNSITLPHFVDICPWPFKYDKTGIGAHQFQNWYDNGQAGSGC